jgi:hypothetical protein
MLQMLRCTETSQQSDVMGHFRSIEDVRAMSVLASIAAELLRCSK